MKIGGRATSEAWARIPGSHHHEASGKGERHGGASDTDLGPVRSIQSSVLNRLGDMLALHLKIVFQISNRSSHLQDAIMRAGAQALLLHGAFQHAFAIGIKFTVGPDLARSHLGIRVGSPAALPRGSILHLLWESRSDELMPFPG